MFATLWNDFLYVPLINLLVQLYNTVAGENMVWAVVWLTVLLRIVLLPFSILSERNKVRYHKLEEEVEGIERQFKNDPIAKKEFIRKLLKQHHISPWAKTVVFLFQVLVFFVLYRVFLGGIRGKISVDMLYPSVDFPVILNTNFFGFDATEPSFIWSGIVAVILFLEVWWDQRSEKHVSKRELWYSVLFPGAVFVGLSMLPMVKSVFVLTSIVFSAIISSFGKLFSGGEKHH